MGTPMTFTVGSTVVEAIPQGFTRHRLNVYELRPVPGAKPPPHPMLDLPPLPPKPVKSRVSRPTRATKPAAPAVTATPVAPVPATQEHTMPRTTTTEKTDKINAFRALHKLPALTEEQATELLKANAMSPKRVIKAMREALPKTEPAKADTPVWPHPTPATKGVKADVPETDPAITKSSSAHTLSAAELRYGKAGKVLGKAKPRAVKNQPGATHIPADAAAAH